MKWYYPFIALPIYLLFSLPLWMLYGLSTFLYWVMYYVIAYRKKVVRENLNNAFPQKSKEELLAIEQEYYKHMVDVIIETLKLTTISAKELQKRVVFKNPELVQSIIANGQSFVFVLGHQGNWEWSGPSYASLTIGELHGIYHPLSNTFFNWLIIKIRSRHGLKLVAMNQVMRLMAGFKNKPSGIAFIADQTPMPETAYWTTFLNQDTPVFVGTEKIARRFDYPVVYASNKKLKRGHYEIEFSIITYTPATTPEGWITEQHTQLLEKDIINQPAYWLWSHKRWKHKRVTS